MSKNKTKIFFWLKIDKNFFENLAIKQARLIPGGDTMIIIYQRLLLESLNTQGILYYEGALNSLEKELALSLNESEDNIRMTLSFFRQAKLIQIDDEMNAEMLQVPALLEQETSWAHYKRKQRKVPKLDNVQPVSNNCPTDIEIEKEIELEKDTRYNVGQSPPTGQRPDFAFPSWLSQQSIDALAKHNPKIYALSIPIQYLNQMTGSRYKFIDRNLRLIKSRFKDGFTLDDFKTVIDNKVAEWGNSDEWSKYLRPETLFGSKFEGYVNQKPKGRVAQATNVPEWSQESYRTEATEEELAELERLRREMTGED